MKFYYCDFYFRLVVGARAFAVRSQHWIVHQKWTKEILARVARINMDCSHKHAQATGVYLSFHVLALKMISKTKIVFFVCAIKNVSLLLVCAFSSLKWVENHVQFSVEIFAAELPPENTNEFNKLADIMGPIWYDISRRTLFSQFHFYDLCRDANHSQKPHIYSDNSIKNTLEPAWER